MKKKIINERNVNLLERQVETDSIRLDKGEISLADLAQSESSLAGARANFIQSQNEVITNKLNYENVIGPLQQINSLIESKFQSTEECNEEIYIARIIASAVLHKRDIFDATIYKGFQQLGLVSFYSTVMFVSLQKLGLIWSVNSKVVDHERFVFGLLQEKINDITNEIITKKFSKDIWLLFVMAPYIFLDRDDGHFVSLNNTVGMVTEASVDHKTKWST